MNNQEALLIRSFYSDESVKLATRNNKIGAIRRFLMWERDENKAISFDDMFFDYLIQYEEPSKTHGKSIPDEDLGKISAWLATQASASHEMDLTYSPAVSVRRNTAGNWRQPSDASHCLYPGSK